MRQQGEGRGGEPDLRGPVGLRHEERSVEEGLMCEGW